MWIAVHWEIHTDTWEEIGGLQIPWTHSLGHQDAIKPLFIYAVGEGCVYTMCTFTTATGEESQAMAIGRNVHNRVSVHHNLDSAKTSKGCLHTRSASCLQRCFHNLSILRNHLNLRIVSDGKYPSNNVKLHIHKSVITSALLFTLCS